MSQAFRIISYTVGKGGHEFGQDVQRVKQLLGLNGYAVTKNDRWDRSAEEALLDFRRRVFGQVPFAMVEDGDPNETKRTSITPKDMVLFELAYRANVLVRLPAPLTGAEALRDVHDWLVHRDVGFSWNRVAWALDGMPNWAIVTSMVDDKPISKQFYGFDFPDTEQRLALNCTLYANLMMSVWLHGNVHRPPFAAGIADSGFDLDRKENRHLAVNRYNYKLLGEYKSLADIKQQTDPHPTSLFCIEAGNIVGHMAVVLQGEVYQCNYGRPACTRTTLEHFVKGHPAGWLSGPAPSQ